MEWIGYKRSREVGLRLKKKKLNKGIEILKKNLTSPNPNFQATCIFIFIRLCVNLRDRLLQFSRQ